MPPPKAGAAQGAVQRLRAGGAATPAGTSTGPAAATALVTGTGFYGSERAAVRELARLAGVQYSGDLVQGRTTHLVLAPSAGGGATRKVQKAAEWGIPALRLQWLLDSVAAGTLQPTGPYLMDFDEVEEPQAAPDGSGGAAAAQHTASCRELPARHRPSSVASNPLQPGAPQQAGGALQAAAAAMPAGCASGCKPASQQEAVQPGRAPLAPVANRLADQLRRMSIAPEDQLGHQQQDSQQQQLQQHGQPQPSDSPPQQRSPSMSLGSPQRSLSLQGMLAADAALTSPEEGDSSAAAAACDAQWAEQVSSEMDAGEERERGWSPMQDSSAGDSPQHQQPGSQQQEQHSQGPAAGGLAQPSPGGAASPFAFSLAGALGRSVSDEMAYGSPMAASPAAPVGLGNQVAGAASAGRSTAGGSRLRSASPASPAPSSMACTPAGAGSQGDPLATLPTPACIRDWSDDDSSLGGSPLADAVQPEVADDRTGPTQTPPAVRQAIAAAMGPTQVPPAQQQASQQKQQQPLLPPQQQEQVEFDADGAVSGGETVASEPPAAGDLVVSDSGSDSEQAPSPLRQDVQQQWQQRHQQQGQQRASTSPDPSPMQPHSQQQQPRQPGAFPDPSPVQPPPQQQQPAAAPGPSVQKRRGLLQISRVGQPPATSSRWQATAAGPAGTAAAPSQLRQHAGGRAAEPAAAATFSGGVAPLPSPGGDWEPAGHGDASPASVASAGHSPALLPAGQHDEQRPAASRSSAGPAVDEHFVTSRRPGPGASRRQPTAAAARRSVREWSESDSSEDEFPTPTGQRSRGGLGLTGLTQLDPSSIVIARPKPSGSALLRGGGPDQGVVVGLKFLQRPPRGNAVREHHGLPNLKTVQFAEQVQVTPLSLLLSTKDKKTAVRLRPGGLLSRTEEEAEDDEFRPTSSSGSRGRRSSASSSARTGGGGGVLGGAAAAGGATAESGGRGRQQVQQQEDEEPVLGEPQTFYRLADGSWHFELCRFYTAAQAEAAAAAAGRTLVLPQGFDRSCELLKALEREHAPMADIAGGIQIRRVKQGGSMLRLRGGTASRASLSYYWRLALDTATWRVVTDRAAADFVAVE